jgi:hypothetical protein
MSLYPHFIFIFFLWINLFEVLELVIPAQGILEFIIKTCYLIYEVGCSHVILCEHQSIRAL